MEQPSVRGGFRGGVRTSIERRILVLNFQSDRGDTSEVTRIVSYGSGRERELRAGGSSGAARGPALGDGLAAGVEAHRVGAVGVVVAEQ